MKLAINTNQVKWWFLRRGEPRENLSVQSREPTNLIHINYDAGSGNRTRATLVGGECSHHCATASPLFSSGGGTWFSNKFNLVSWFFFYKILIIIISESNRGVHTHTHTHCTPPLDTPLMSLRGKVTCLFHCNIELFTVTLKTHLFSRKQCAAHAPALLFAWKVCKWRD